MSVRVQLGCATTVGCVAAVWMLFTPPTSVATAVLAGVLVAAAAWFLIRLWCWSDARGAR